MCPCSAAGTEEFDVGAYTSNSNNTTKTLLLIIGTICQVNT